MARSKSLSPRLALQAVPPHPPHPPVKELKEHLHSLKMHLSRQKGPAVFSSTEKHETKMPEAGTESWVSLLQRWEANGGVKVLFCVWVCLC